MSAASHNILALLAEIEASNPKPKTLDQARMAIEKIHAAASQARTALAAVPPAPAASTVTVTATSPTSSIPPRPGLYSTPEAHRVWNAAIVLKAQDLGAKCPTWAKLGRLGTDAAREAFFASHREQLMAEEATSTTHVGVEGAARALHGRDRYAADFARQVQTNPRLSGMDKVRAATRIKT